MKASQIQKENINIFMQVDEQGNAGYIRFAHVDKESKEEVQYLGALDTKDKKQLLRLKTFIDNMLTPSKGKKSKS